MYKSVTDFIREIYCEKEAFIPLHAPVFQGNEKKYLLETIDSTYVSSVGAYVNQFEEMMAGIAQVKRAVAVVNGTAALQVALRLVGVRPGDEVITQALSFVATANAIAYNNANPIFIDVDLDTMGLSPQALENFLEEHAECREDGCFNRKTGKRVSACVPMHTFGFPVHLDELLKVCRKWQIPVVEDAAESLGSTYKNQPIGSFGQVSICSFNGNKIVTCGGGGAILTNDESLGKAGKHLTTTAKVPHAYEYVHDQLGYNYRMPNLNAALACAQLEQLPAFLESKRRIASQYESFFKEKGIRFRKEAEGTRANYWLMAIELESKKERDAFLAITNQEKVMTRPIWQLLFRLPMYGTFQRDGQENAGFLEERIVNIPSSVR